MLSKKILMNCPLCDKTHEVEERSRTNTLFIKDLQVEYEEFFYVCSNSKVGENEFETGKMTNQNLMNARNEYRREKGYLTSNEIVALREKYGVSQVELAKLLGWGEATVSRYESKAIQDEAYDNMLRLIKNDPLIALEYLEKNAHKFVEERRMEIKQCIMKAVDEHGKEFVARQSLKCDYVVFDNPSDINGYTLLNIDKVESVISYYAEKLSDLYKGKMMPMLWYADAMSYKRHQKSITGLVYQENDMGAVPVGINHILALDKVNLKEEESVYGSKFLFMRHNGVDQTCLSEDEVKILDNVINKFRDYSVQDMVVYMQEEQAHKETSRGEIISFERAKKIREFA